jgi:hypothetical protein
MKLIDTGGGSLSGKILSLSMRHPCACTRGVGMYRTARWGLPFSVSSVLQYKVAQTKGKVPDGRMSTGEQG